MRSPIAAPLLLFAVIVFLAPELSKISEANSVALPEPPDKGIPLVLKVSVARGAVTATLHFAVAAATDPTANVKPLGAAKSSLCQ